MATLLTIGKCRVVVFSDDHPHPAHVHVFCAECASKWELDPLRCVQHRGCDKGTLRRIGIVLINRMDEILERWHAHWNERKNLGRE